MSDKGQMAVKWRSNSSQIEFGIAMDVIVGAIYSIPR